MIVFTIIGLLWVYFLCFHFGYWLAWCLDAKREWDAFWKPHDREMESLIAMVSTLKVAQGNTAGSGSED